MTGPIGNGGTASKLQTVPYVVQNFMNFGPQMPKIGPDSPSLTFAKVAPQSDYNSKLSPLCSQPKRFNLLFGNGIASGGLKWQ